MCVCILCAQAGDTSEPDAVAQRASLPHLQKLPVYTVSTLSIFVDQEYNYEYDNLAYISSY